MRDKKYLDRYALYLHDIRAFNETIRTLFSSACPNWIANSPEELCEGISTVSIMMTASQKSSSSIPSATTATAIRPTMPTSFRRMCRGSLPGGTVAICQEHVTDSLQALMKADYMLALNSGSKKDRDNIRRCIICGRYFLLKSGVHALYCEGACPRINIIFAPTKTGYTCRQFGTVELQKELAKDIPKVKVKVTAFARITKDMQRGAISQEDASQCHLPFGAKGLCAGSAL